MRNSLGRRLSMAGLATVLLATFTLGLAAAGTRQEKLDRAREATDQFHNLVIAMDGREAGGRMASAGLYFARLSTQHGSVARRIVRVN